MIPINIYIYIQDDPNLEFVVGLHSSSNTYVRWLGHMAMHGTCFQIANPLHLLPVCLSLSIKSKEHTSDAQTPKENTKCFLCCLSFFHPKRLHPPSYACSIATAERFQPAPMPASRAREVRRSDEGRHVRSNNVRSRWMMLDP